MQTELGEIFATIRLFFYRILVETSKKYKTGAYLQEGFVYDKIALILIK